MTDIYNSDAVWEQLIALPTRSFTGLNCYTPNESPNYGTGSIVGQSYLTNMNTIYPNVIYHISDALSKRHIDSVYDSIDGSFEFNDLDPRRTYDITVISSEYQGKIQREVSPTRTVNLIHLLYQHLAGNDYTAKFKLDVIDLENVQIVIDNIHSERISFFC